MTTPTTHRLAAIGPMLPEPDATCKARPPPFGRDILGRVSGALWAGLALGALLGGLAAALWSSRGAARLREELARARAERDALGDSATRQRDQFVALSTEALQGHRQSLSDLVRPVERTLQ